MDPYSSTFCHFSSFRRVFKQNNIHRRSRDVLLVSGMRNLGHPVPLPEFRFYVQSKQFGEEYKV
jgi:hypothetical protein